MKIKALIKPGKVALVTGGSSGIGKAIACGLAERGMDVWIIAQRKELLEAAHKELEGLRKSPTQFFGTVSADISDLNQVRDAIKQVTEKSGTPDLLVNSAGVAHPGYAQDLDINIYNWMMEVNYFGTVYVTKELLPAMVKRGSGYIANISSGAGFISYFGYTAYASSKAAVKAFTDALRQEMKPLGIGCSIIYPADTDTPQLEYEDKYKPVETKALSGFGGKMSAEEVAKTIIKGIEHGTYRIILGLELNLIYHVYYFSEGLVQYIIDLIIADARKKKNSVSSQKE